MSGKEAELTKQEVELWSQERDRCQLCGIKQSEAWRRRFPPGLQTHHIIGGPRRKNYSWNFLRLCSRCHNAHHSGGERLDSGERYDVTLGMILECKRREGDWEPEKLRLLRGRIIEPQELPREVMEERNRNGYFPQGEK